MTDNKTAAICRILKRQYAVAPARILVVGCGSGEEAAILAREFSADVIGIDVEDNFHPEWKAAVDLRVGDATKMLFAIGQFDLVYSYHALEHIPDYLAALREIRRVTAPGGVWCIGTPNRHRAIGYLGSKNASVRQKLEWNVADWRMRLTGRFRNEHGAHAGFSTGELSRVLSSVFQGGDDISRAYYLEIYPRHRTAIEVLSATGLGRLLLPSIYFSGRVA